MRLHTDTLTLAQVRAAVKQAGAYPERLEMRGSRKRDHAFDVILSGDSPRWGHTGNFGAADYKAASWDQWGIVLAALFALDPDLTVPGVYVDGEHFHEVTVYRFDTRDGITSRADKRYHANHAWNVPTKFRGRECKCGAQRDYSALVGA